MGSVDVLLRRWSLGDRQQRSGTSVAHSGSGKKELSLRWIGPRWRKRCGDLQSDRNSKTKRDRSGKLSAKRSVPHRRAPDQSYRRTAAVESRRGTVCETMKPTEDKL